MATGTDRIAQVFAAAKAAGEPVLMPYVMAGYPDYEGTVALAAALSQAGAGLIELGMPFSDPLADGVTIQHASFEALQRGVNLDFCLEMAEKIGMEVTTPILLMGYYNPVLNYGIEHFCTAAEFAGVAGLIIPDLPPEEAEEMRNVAHKHGLDLIFLLSPSSTEDRIKLVTSLASGFIYCVSVIGITGARQTLSAELPDFIARVRKHTSLPLAVGFGISTREQVEQVGAIADGVVIASALITLLENLPPEEQPSRAAAFLSGLHS